MVYKAVLLDPTVGYILSNKTSTDKIRENVYGPLMNDKDFYLDCSWWKYL